MQLTNLLALTIGTFILVQAAPTSLDNINGTARTEVTFSSEKKPFNAYEAPIGGACPRQIIIAIAYADINFAGDYVDRDVESISGGCQDFPPLFDISSLKVYRGYQCTFWDTVWCSGSGLHVFAGDLSYVGDYFNDNIASWECQYDHT